MRTSISAVMKSIRWYKAYNRRFCSSLVVVVVVMGAGEVQEDFFEEVIFELRSE